jgi:hypothetical protein
LYFDNKGEVKMGIICRISDDKYGNSWDDDIETQEPQSIHDITIADIMGEDLNIWIGKNKEFGYIMEIDGENGRALSEKCIHPFAMESMAYFCRRFLGFYDQLEEK